VGGNQSTRRKPTTCGRALTDSFHTSPYSENRAHDFRGDRCFTTAPSKPLGSLFDLLQLAQVYLYWVTLTDLTGRSSLRSSKRHSFLSSVLTWGERHMHELTTLPSHDFKVDFNIARALFCYKQVKIKQNKKRAQKFSAELIWRHVMMSDMTICAIFALADQTHKVVQLNRFVTSCSNNLLSSCNSTISQQVVSKNLVASW
jgi:hypothetical protein